MGAADPSGRRRRAAAQLLLEAVPPLVRLLRGALQAGAGPVTVTQARILGRLEAGPRLVGELAAAMEIRAPTASVAVQALVRRGLARRLSDEADRRVAPVALTEQGRRVLRDARRRQLDALTRLLDGLGDDELAALEAGLHGLARARARPGGAPRLAQPAKSRGEDAG